MKANSLTPQDQGPEAKERREETEDQKKPENTKTRRDKRRAETRGVQRLGTKGDLKRPDHRLETKGDLRPEYHRD